MPTTQTNDLAPVRPLGRLPGISYGFFGREGGVSTGQYASLNCRTGSKDAPENIAENRRRVARYLGADKEKLLTLRQIHSNICITVDHPWNANEDIPEADALATATPGLVLGALSADCGPVLFADPQAGVIGAAHAGWRGAVSGVLEATIEKMEKLGAKRQQIQAALGPTISMPHYEVGEEFKKNLCEIDPDHAQFFALVKNTARPHFDLPAFIMFRLKKAGIKRVKNINNCTYASESRYYSYRYDSQQGRTDYGCQIAAIVLD